MISLLHSSTWIRQLCCLVCFIGLAKASCVIAAPSRSNNYSSNYSQDPNTTVLKELRETLEKMRHQVNNHESEWHTFDEKLKNLDIIIESLRDQLSESSKSQKEQLKGSASALETKITALETAEKGLVADLRQFQTHANDTSAVLGQYKQKIDELEAIITQQNQNIDHLQGALRALMDALQLKEEAHVKNNIHLPVAVGEGRAYQVKAGDSLERIARQQNTTVQAIKELNGLTSDKIVVGKVLQLPPEK